MKEFTKIISQACIALLASIGAQTICAQPLYTIRDLTPINERSTAYGLNNLGQVTGATSTSGSPGIAFLTDGASRQSLGTLKLDLRGYEFTSSSYGSSINDKGHVVGGSNSTSRGSITHAFFYDGNAIHDLGTLGGKNSWATSINAAGIIVGAADTSQTVPPGSATSGWPIVHAFVYSNGTMNDLGTIRGYTESYASSINADGWVTGSVSTTFSRMAFIYDGIRMSPIPGLIGNSEGRAINASGWVAGNVDGRAFLYEGDRIVDLGQGFYSSVGNGINDDGWVVGHASAIGIGRFALVYDGSTVWNLNNLLDPSSSNWHISDAFAINNAGQILAAGSNIYGESRSLLLTPVPEPGSTALLGFGLVSLFSIRRYRRT